MSINVANNNPHVVYTVAEGATQTTFSITFEFFDDDEVQLYVDGIIKTQGSGDGNYTITGGEGSTGTATFNTVSSGTQPVTGITGGSQVVVTRNIPIERVTDFSAGSDINRAALNTQLDTLTAIAADNKMRSVRALTAPISDPTDVGTNLIIPKAADRANGFLSFDSSGNVAINSVVDLSFLTLERLDIDNVRIDGNTVSSTTGNLILAPTVDVEINIPASSSLYMQRAGSTGIEVFLDGDNQQIRFINTTTSTTFSSIKSTHLGGTVSDLSLNTDGGALNLNPSNGTLVFKDNDTQRGYFDLNTAGTIKVYAGTGSGTLNTTFESSNVSIAGNLTLGGSLKAPASFTIDPATHGDNTGTLIVAGNLQVDGTTTTINSTTLTVDDKNIVLASGAADSAAANGAGITIDGASATMLYTHGTTSFDFNKNVNVTGNFSVSGSITGAISAGSLAVDNITIDGNTISSTDTNGKINLRCNGTGVVDVDSEIFVYGNASSGTAAYVQIGNTDTGGDDVRLQGPNPNVTLFDTSSVSSGVAAYTGGVLFYGQLTSTAYHTYAAIRPRIIDGLDSDSKRDGGLHIGVSDGASSALTNIILKVEPTGADVTGNITVSGTVDGRDLQTDGTKLDNIEANADVTDATNVAAAGAAMTSSANFIGDVTIKTSDGGELKLQTSDTTVGINDVLGKLSFNAPNEASGTDAILEAASIKAVAASTFTSSSNATRLQFSTGNSEAAQIRMTIAPEGTVSVGSISTNAGYNDGTAIMSVGRGTDTYNILAINHSADANNVGQINFVGNTDANSAKIVHAPSAGMMQFYVGDAVGNRILNLHDDTSISAQNGFGVDSSGVIDGHGLTLGNNHKAIFGAGSALQIYHDGTDSYISEGGTGDLKIQGANVRLENPSGVRYFQGSSGVSYIYNSGDIKLNTTSTGIDVTGNATFADNGKAIFGAGSDLQIYHDGSASYIDDAGTGNLFVRGNNLALKNADGSKSYFFGTNGGAANVYYDGASKLATTSTGVDVTGTVTADGLTFGAEGQKIEFFTSSAPRPFITASDTYQTNGLDIDSDNGITLKYDNNDNGAGGVIIKRDSTNKSVFQADSNGDISFYDSAGSSQSFFWDASAESLGIGTSSPSVPLHIDMGTDNNALYIQSSDQFANIGLIDGSGSGKIIMDGGDLSFTTGGNATTSFTGSTERMRIDSSGRVGIGGSPSTRNVEIIDTNPTLSILSDTTTGASQLLFGDSADDNVGRIYYGHTNNEMRFYTNADEAMRIDSSGNLLVGKTSTDYTTAGVMVEGDGTVSSVKAGVTGVFNRLTTDGDIMQFRKDGSTVGSISSRDGVATNLILRTATGQGAGIGGANSGVLPCDEDGLQDDEINLGAGSRRWNDIYATNGTIQTSDRNEKQDIAELSDAEQRVAVAAKGLLRKFRWRDAVEAKGDEARTHFGIIAQDLQAAFATEGLDAGDYAMFISSTWTDEETGEERTRMGVRYSELLAFIIAAI